MKHSRITALLAALVVFAAILASGVPEVEAAGNQYYVDSAGGADSNSGASPDSPWKSLSKVTSRTYAAGDTINFKAGSSFSGGLTFKSSGTASAPITLQAYGTGSRPVFSNPGANLGNVIRIEANYVTIRGLLLTDAHRAGVYVLKASQGAVIEDNEIKDVGVGVLLAGQNNRVAGNDIHDLRMVVSDSGDNNNDYGANGVLVQNSNQEIAHNRFSNNRAPSIDYGYDGGAIELWGDLSNVSIHDNYSSGGQGFLEQGGGDVSNIRLERNESRDYAAFVMLHLDPNHAHGGTANGFVMEANTIVRSLSPKAYRVLDIQGSPSASQVVFKDNLVYSNMTVARDGDHGHTGNRYFLVDGAAVGSSLGTGETTLNGSGISVEALAYNVHFGSGVAPILASRQSSSQFQLGFGTLAGLLGGVAGDPIEAEQYNGENGDSLQQTTTGLMVWRKADNWTAFTDGSTTWVNGPFGVQVRSNDHRFPWEA